MRAERFIVDSNVWIAALLSPGGTARTFVDAVIAREIDIQMSEAVFVGLVSRLDRPKFDRYRDREAWDLFRAELIELAQWHEDVGISVGHCRDPDDDKFLALAVTGQADAIITGDQDLLEMGSYQSVMIMTPATFLANLEP